MRCAWVILKAIFCSELEEGTRSRGGQRKRYKDTMKANLKRCDIAPPELEELALDRSDWRSHCKTSVQQFEAGRVRTLEIKREQRKTGNAASLNDLNAASFRCDVCGRSCASRIGLSMHIVALTYQPEITVIRDPSCRRLSPPHVKLSFRIRYVSLYDISSHLPSIRPVFGPLQPETKLSSDELSASVAYSRELGGFRLIDIDRLVIT